VKSPLLLLLWAGALLAPACAASPRAPLATPAAPAAPTSPATSAAPGAPELRVSELLAPGAELRPSDKALALSGQRVRLVGFVAELELPLRGAVYLTALPVHGDEAGGGTADLPPNAVLVSGLPEAAASHVPGPVEATGLFHVGNRADAAGNVSNFQLVLDEGTPSAAAPSASALQARR
jgi:hypothetical protein